MTTIWFGCDIPQDLYYHREQDCWIRFDEEGAATLGMTDIAQTLAGKLLFIRFKKLGKQLAAGKIAATIESGKWIGPFVVPFDSELIATNEEGFKSDILVANKDPYGEGWLIKVKVNDPEHAKKDLMTSDEAFEFFKKKIEDNEIHCFRCAD